MGETGASGTSAVAVAAALGGGAATVRFPGGDLHVRLDGRTGAPDRAGRAHEPAGASIVGVVRRRLLLLAIAVLALTTASTAGAAPRWHTYRIETGGFSVGLPSSWIDVTTTATPAILKELARNPSLKAVAELAGRVDAIKLVAGDAAPSSQAFMDVGVDRVGAIGLDRLAAETARELKQTAHPVGGVRVAKLRLPAGPAYRLTFRFSRPAGSVETVEYLLVRRGVEYGIAYTTLASSARRYDAVFLRSARTFRFLAEADLSHVVLTGAQVGAGYRRASFAGGDSVIGETTLDLCGGRYPSESLRTNRLQVRYLHPGKVATVSNEVVTYIPGGAQQALSEVAGVARTCAAKTRVTRRGADSLTTNASLLTDHKLLRGPSPSGCTSPESSAASTSTRQGLRSTR